MEDMNNSMLWAHISKWYEHLKVVDDINYSGRELRTLVARNNLGLWMRWITLGNAINSIVLWLTWTTPSRELKALDVMNNSGLWMIWTILGHDLKGIDSMNNLGW